MSEIKGYKVFNPDWTCSGFQYKVGETFVHNGNIEICGKGFHFCRKAADCFNYYSFNSNNKVAEVKAVGLVETDGDESVTDKLEIIREVTWTELLTLVNEGHDCTGFRNTGHWNTGHYNIGNRNTGHYNTGDWNTGNYNTGDWNTGNRNTGHWNTGHYNIGNRNTGNRNTGHWNTGHYNTGDWNTGRYNTGDWNTGDWNTGDWNTGDWNSANYSSGFLNSISQPIYLFNKLVDLTRSDIYSLSGMKVLNWNFENSWWIYSKNMSDEEKSNHPEHETTGGYLKTVDFYTACRMMWEGLSDDEKQSVFALPNFDAAVFKDITGIDVTGGES